MTDSLHVRLAFYNYSDHHMRKGMGDILLCWGEDDDRRCIQIRQYCFWPRLSEQPNEESEELKQERALYDEAGQILAKSFDPPQCWGVYHDLKQPNHSSVGEELALIEDRKERLARFRSSLRKPTYR